MGGRDRPYGAWPSPFSTEMVVAGARTISEVRVDGDDVYWLEGRPDQGGRYVVVRRGPDGTPKDVTPEGSNVRTRVHEYGGGSYVVSDGTVWYVEYADQGLYRLEPGGPRPVTPEPDRRAAVRYADFDRSPDGRWLAAVRETHHGERAEQVVSEVVAIPADGMGEERVLATGHD
ncbi:MAG: S9 family peptidase, partial [Actinomycetota bacterium]|nr:S9 family peptidase [Actinomycetota bacterium]